MNQKRELLINIFLLLFILSLVSNAFSYYQCILTTTLTARLLHMVSFSVCYTYGNVLVLYWGQLVVWLIVVCFPPVSFLVLCGTILSKVWMSCHFTCWKHSYKFVFLPFHLCNTHNVNINSVYSIFSSVKLMTIQFSSL